MKNKNNKKGIRYQILYLLANVGILSYRSINILDDSVFPLKKRTINDKIKEMTKEEIIAKVKAETPDINETLFTLKIRNKTVDIIISETISADIIENQQDKKRQLERNLRQKKDLQRIILDSETSIMMYASGYNTFLDQEGESKYFNSREIKRYTGYVDEIKREKRETEEAFVKRVGFSKLYGLAISEGGAYAVYHTYKGGLGNLSFGESKIRNHLSKVIEAETGKFEKVTEAIILLKSLDYLKNNLVSKDATTKEAKRYIAFSNVYDSLIVLPYSKEGRDMLRFMRIKKWKNQILEDTLGFIQDTSLCNCICDAYEPEQNSYTLVFCIPDIARLKSFLDYASLVNDKDKFCIICFDYQKSFIASVAGQYAKIKVANFKEYFEEIKKIYNV